MMSLYDSLAHEWRRALESGEIFAETDQSFYSRIEVRAQFDELEQGDITMLDIATATAHHFDISRAELMCHRRYSKYARPRFVAIHLIREILPHKGVTDMGKFFNRDHTTICHGLTRAVELLEVEQSFCEAVAAVRGKLE